MSIVKEIQTGSTGSLQGWFRDEYTGTEKITENFSVAEHNCKCGRCELQRCSTLLYPSLQKLRKKIGVPIVISSGYRCSNHNKKVGGSTGSRHIFGEAVDIKVEMNLKEAAEEAVRIGFKGIGIYKSWLHLDVRSAPFAVWGGKIDDTFIKRLRDIRKKKFG